MAASSSQLKGFGEYQFSAAVAFASTNVSESFHRMVVAAAYGHPAAQHKLASAYSNGIYYERVPIDPGRYFS